MLQLLMSDGDDILYFPIVHGVFMSPSSTPYRKLWRRIFQAPRSSVSWPNILSLVELLFTIPISNAKLERMFSQLALVKSGRRSRLSLSHLDSLLRIGQEGPKFEDYDVTNAMLL